MTKHSYLSWQLASLTSAALFFLPIITLFILAFNTDGSAQIWTHLRQTVLSDYVTGSLTLVLGVSIVTLIIGVGSAWLVSQYSFLGSKFLNWGLLLPLAMPTYIIAYSYTGMLDVAGPIQNFIRETFDVRFGQYWFPEIRSMGGAIFVISFVLYPYVYLLVLGINGNSGRLRRSKLFWGKHLYHRDFSHMVWA